MGHVSEFYRSHRSEISVNGKVFKSEKAARAYCRSLGVGAVINYTGYFSGNYFEPFVTNCAEQFDGKRFIKIKS